VNPFVKTPLEEEESSFVIDSTDFSTICARNSWFLGKGKNEKP